ncbi:MAG TPA: hypothetical protein DDY31_10880 [Lachnospiraceae bacterium]|nr:hypothetical protein [Lachnospiraceae bacterium]
MKKAKREPLMKLRCMEDFIDRTLPEYEQRCQICGIILEEFSHMNPEDLEYYLECFGLDLVVPGLVIKLKFPIEALVFKPDFRDVEFNRRQNVGDMVESG